MTSFFSPPFSHSNGHKHSTRRAGLASGSPRDWGKCLKDLGKFKFEGQWEMGRRGGWRYRKEQEKLEVSPQRGGRELSQRLLNGTPGELGGVKLCSEGTLATPHPLTVGLGVGG